MANAKGLPIQARTSSKLVHRVISRRHTGGFKRAWMRGVSEEYPAPFPWWRGENRIIRKNGRDVTNQGGTGSVPSRLFPASVPIQKKNRTARSRPSLKQGRPILSCSGQDTVGSSQADDRGNVERQNTASEPLATPLFSLKATIRGLVSVH
jgi:hypothetical protein